MAKISANGNTEVARVRYAQGQARGIMVLRSDGVVLQRLTGDLSTGYTRMGKVKVMPTDKHEAERLLARVAGRRGRVVVGLS